MNIELEHERHTGVMFVNACPAPEQARISVIDVGEQFGFKSEILARVDSETDTLYGLIITDFSAFKREVRLKYYAASAKSALQMLVGALMAGLCIHRKHESRAAMMA